jgi:hypothetical protein
MAKVDGLFKIAGTLDELTFYRLKGKHVVRKKGGGFNSKSVLTGPNHIRTRENASEFGNCSRMGKAFRVGLMGMLLPNEFDSMSQRVQKLMLDLKNCDDVSERGKRTPGLGILTQEGRQLLSGFSFNECSQPDQLLMAPYELGESSFRIGNLLPKRDVRFPKGATHVGFALGQYVFDFEEGKGKVFASEPIFVAKGAACLDLEIPAPAYNGSGIVLPVLKMRFFQEAGGVLYAFKDKEFGVLAILSID